MMRSSTHHRGGAFDGAQDAQMRAAAAFQSGQRIVDLGLARLLVVAQERRGGHEPAVDAVTALRHPFLDVRGLQRMRLFRRTEAGTRGDLAVAVGNHRSDTCAYRLIIATYAEGDGWR